MRPRIFIGSSSERLEIAYAIQENLENETQPTVWTQGIFKLSNSSLDSLINALDNFDYAVFVFHPDDITQTRGNSFETVRDNLLFELGLFIGRLGKERVFFLIPRTIDKLHLPTDLLGITAGTYDNQREDGNLLASLGPFCNKIREQIKDFVYENIEDIQNEPKYIKKIVIEKTSAWEHLFAAELLNYKLIEINNSYSEIENNLAVLKFKTMTGKEFFNWFGATSENINRYINLFEGCMNELNTSFGPLGVPGKPIEIKNAVERIALLCRELLNIEYELYGINPPKELETAKKKLKNWTKTMFVDEINRIHMEIRQVAISINKRESSEAQFVLTINMIVPSSVHESMEDFKKYLLEN